MQRHRLGRDHVHQRTALGEREHRLVDPLRQLRAAEDHAAARPAQHLVRGGADHVGVRHRRRYRAAGDQADDVRGVDHQVCTDLVGDVPERAEVDQARVRRRTTDDHLRPVREGEVAYLVVVDRLGVLADVVPDGAVPAPGKVDLAAVGEVPAMRQVHREHGVPRLHQRRVRGQVRAGAAVRLQVGVPGAEQRHRPLDRQRLRPVDLGAAAIVAPARIPLGVLVGQRRAQGRQHRRRGQVLARDQLQPAAQPGQLTEQHGRDLRIRALQLAEVRTPERGHTDNLD